MGNGKITAVLAASALVAVGTVFLMTFTAERHTTDHDVVPNTETSTFSDTKPTVTAAPKAKSTTAAATAVGTTSTVTTSTATAEETTVGVLYIDLNTADTEQLRQLEGIGDVLAERIAEYRENVGKFNNIEEIMLVDGIGEKIFGDIRDNIYVTDPIYPEPPTESDTASEEATEPVTEAEATTAIPETEPSTEHVPTLDEIAPIDLNKATADELMLLPYVDEEIAQKILALREGIGGFKHPYELLYIEELEQKQVAEILNFVIVVQ